MENSLLTHTIFGSVKNAPVDALIRAYDHDLLQNELLGQSLINGTGFFEIKFSPEDFSGKWFHLEKKPDIYLRVFSREGKCIHVTDVYKNIRSEHFRVDLELKSAKPNLSETIEVNTQYLPLLTQDDLLNAFQLLIHPTKEVANQSIIVKVFPHILTGFNLLELYDERFRDLFLDRHMPIIPSNIIAQFFPDQNSNNNTLRTFQTAHISVTYNPQAVNSINDNYIIFPARDEVFEVFDNGTRITIGTVSASFQAPDIEPHPTYVQKIGLAAEYAYLKYMLYGFRDPNTNPSGRITIISSPPPYVLPDQVDRELGLTITSSSSPVIWITSLLDSGKAIFLTVVHELFHMVQLQYHPSNFAMRTGFRQMIIEGGACFMEDCFVDSSNNYIAFANQEIFRRDLIPNQPLEYSYIFSEEKKTVAYAGGLFWKYMARLHSQIPYSDPFHGTDVQKKLLEVVSQTSQSFGLDTLNEFKKSLSPYGTFDSFVWVTGSNSRRELISKESSWGNYLLAKCLHKIMDPAHPRAFDARFDFYEDNERYTSNTLNLLLNDLGPKVTPCEILINGPASSRSGDLNPYQVVYYEIIPEAGHTAEEYFSRMFKIRLTTDNPMGTDSKAIVKMGLIRQPVSSDLSSNETLQDIYQTEDSFYTKLINLSGFSKIILMIASRENALHYEFVYALNDGSDLMITRWNTHPGKEYEINPANHSWGWLSPDIIVDNNNDLLDDGLVYTNLPEGQANNLKVRIRNKGNQNGIDTGNRFDLQVFTQKMTTMVDPDRWVLMQTLSSIDPPAPGDEKWFTIPWAITEESLTNSDWLVKVKIVPDFFDNENADNKEAITHFSNVRPYTVSIPHRKTCKFSLAGCGDLLFIPRGDEYTLSRKLNPFSNPSKVFDIRPGKFFSEYIALDIEKAGNMKAWDGAIEPENINGYYFPLNQTALPPGLKTENLVTVTQLVNGIAIGGVSYRISEKK